MMEWVELGGGQVLVATEDRTWLHGATLVPSDPFLAAMTGEGSVATTGRLLDAAVGMSQRAGREPGYGRRPRSIDRRRDPVSSEPA